MIRYKKYHLPGEATLRVSADKIVATVSSKERNMVDIYVENLALPFHIPINEDYSAKSIMDYTWERHLEIDDINE